MAQKNTRAVGSRARLSQAQNWYWKAENHYCISNLTNPMSKTFMGSIHLINSAFLSLKIIVDTLTDVGNAKYQNITSKISKLIIKSKKVIKTHNLAFRCECTSRFQGTAASKVQLTSAQGQLYSSSKVSPTIFQTELRITDHRGHKFSPSLTLLSVQNSNRMASRFTTIASFPSVFLQLLQRSSNIQVFQFTGLLWSQKLTWSIQHFLKICRFRSSILVSL